MTLRVTLDPAALDAGKDDNRARREPEHQEKIMRKNKITLSLPPEFIRLCEHDGIKPEVVLRGFIADLCGIMNWANNPRTDGYSSNGSDERLYAERYYERVGYPYINHEP